MAKLSLFERRRRRVRRMLAWTAACCRAVGKSVAAWLTTSSRKGRLKAMRYHSRRKVIVPLRRKIMVYTWHHCIMSMVSKLGTCSILGMFPQVMCLHQTYGMA